MALHFQDPAENQILRALTPEVRTSVSRRIVAELGDELRRVLATRVGDPRRIPPEEASPALHAAMSVLESRLRERASYYSPLRWLWSIRRLPSDFFTGRVATTDSYDRSLAEVLTAGSTAEDDHIQTESGDFAYEFGGGFPRRVAELCEGARFLSDLHSALRWAGKGAHLEITRDGLLRRHASPDLAEAVRVYDQRVATPRNLPAGSPAGTVAVEEATGAASTDNVILTVPQLDRPTSVLLKPPVVPIEGTVSARYCGVPLSITPLMRLLDDPRLATANVFATELGDLLLLARSIVIHRIRFPRHYKTILERGYLLTHRERIHDVFRAMFHQADALVQRVEQVWGPKDISARLETLTNTQGSAWPLQPGPVIRSGGEAMCIDLSSLSRRIDTLMRFPAVQGDAANARAEHFEESTQALVDHTRWAPPAEVRAVRGHALQRGAQAITDVDAVATRDGVLILISCKSVRYTSGYDTGDYREVRNAESTVTAAASEWRDKVRVFRASPRGDNYDFTPYSSILGVVCTPMVVFCRGDILNAEIAPGLREVSSLDELLHWLEVGTSDASRAREVASPTT